MQPTSSYFLRFVVGLVFLLAGCNAMQQTSKDPGTPVLLVRVANFSYAANDAFPSETTLAIRDPTSWQTLWSQLTKNQSPAPGLPPIDFTKDLVLVAAAGTRPSSGYTVTLAGATQTSAGIVVDITSTGPGAGCAVAAVITSPVDIVTIATTTAPITFNVSHKTQNCP